MHTHKIMKIRYTKQIAKLNHISIKNKEHHLDLSYLVKTFLYSLASSVVKLKYLLIKITSIETLFTVTEM